MAFNKMFVMLPVMLAARKLDGEDPQVSTVTNGGRGFVETKKPVASRQPARFLGDPGAKSSHLVDIFHSHNLIFGALLAWEGGLHASMRLRCGPNDCR